MKWFFILYIFSYDGTFSQHRIETARWFTCNEIILDIAEDYNRKRIQLKKEKDRIHFLILHGLPRETWMFYTKCERI